MVDWYSNWSNRKNLFIKDSEDYRNKLSIAYKQWGDIGFSKTFMEKLEERWFPCTNSWKFIELLKARKVLSKEDYEEKENEVIENFNKGIDALRKFALVCEAEEKALKDAGVKEGKVEYICPICGGTAVANRYKYGGRYHGLGSGCKTCGLRHT